MGWFHKKATDFFSKEEGEEIVKAIQAAEKHTSGEVRVHLEAHCRGNLIKRAAKIFDKLEMEKTKDRCGVLVYLATEDHKFAIFADEGINKVVPNGFWDEIAATMSKAFKQGQFKDGLIAGISKIGEQLHTYFPWQEDDENELPDEISYG